MLLFHYSLSYYSIRIFIVGIGFDAVSEAEAVSRVADFLRQKSSQKFLLATPNPEMVLVAQKNPTFKKILNSTKLSVADGTGILWASYFLSLKKRNFATLVGSLTAIIFAPRQIRKILPARVTGTDLFPRILQFAAVHRKKVFLLGAAPGVAVKVQKKFERQFPNLKISGTFPGSPKIKSEKIICQKIDDSSAEILFVAFGAPAQEIWLARNLPKFKTVRFAAGIGGAFDFHAGGISRAPRIFRKLGLEWLWRLFLQPTRIGRIWNATVRFIFLIWKNRSRGANAKFQNSNSK